MENEQCYKIIEEADKLEANLSIQIKKIKKEKNKVKIHLIKTLLNECNIDQLMFFNSLYGLVENIKPDKYQTVINQIKNTIVKNNKRMNYDEEIIHYCKIIDKCNLLFENPNDSQLAKKLKIIVKRKYSIEGTLTMIKGRLIEYAQDSNGISSDNDKYHLNTLQTQYVLSEDKKDKNYKYSLNIFKEK